MVIALFLLDRLGVLDAYKPGEADRRVSFFENNEDYSSEHIYDNLWTSVSNVKSKASNGKKFSKRFWKTKARDDKVLTFFGT